MLLIETFAPADAVPADTLTLSFELRAKCRLRTRLDSGEEVGLFLPRGTILRGRNSPTSSPCLLYTSPSPRDRG